MAENALQGLLVGYYGDDFTGSTDVLEVLSKAGLRTALLTRVPDLKELDQLSQLDAVGIAGNTRSLPSDRMGEALEPALRLLSGLGARIVHYKVCSTFDSSPAIGSIGRALDLGAEIFDSGPVPVLVAAPELGRYCVFGNLFARSGLESAPFRLDRHPTMRCHPVTPMSESDLRLHLGAQSERQIALFDVLAVNAPRDEAVKAYERLLESRPGAVLIDLLYEHQLATVGDVLWSQSRDDRSLFVVGSSGVEMALAAAWHRSGRVAPAVSFPHPGPAEPLLVLSGSCSPVTRSQVDWVLSKGFLEVKVATDLLVDSDRNRAEEHRVAAEATSVLAKNQSVVVHMALGPDDPRIAATRTAAARRESVSGARSSESDCGHRLGSALGRMGRDILSRCALGRVVVTGGDSSWHVASELGIERLEMVAPMAPGSPLCRACGHGSPADGVEFVFKGGQVGKVDLLEQIARGVP